VPFSDIRGKLSAFAAPVNLSICIRPDWLFCITRGFSIDFTKFPSAGNGVAMDEAIVPFVFLASWGAGH
jgi:hypothetical protein